MKKPWQKEERQDAEDFRARQTPRSGGLWFAKGDSKNETFLNERKTSKYKRFSITQAMWRKIEREALLAKRMPLISAKFGDGIQLVVLDKNDFISLMEKGDEKNESKI